MKIAAETLYDKIWSRYQNDKVLLCGAQYVADEDSSCIDHNGRMNLSIVVLNFLYEWTTHTNQTPPPHTNQTAMLRSGHKSGQVKVLL